MTDINVENAAGWICYDEQCRVCRILVRRCSGPLLRRGFRFVPLQSSFAQRHLQLTPGAPLTEMRVLLPDGQSPGGADALVTLARHIWWAQPLALISLLPGMLPLLRAVYRDVAKRRSCATGACALPTTGARQTHLPSPAGTAQWPDWLPLGLLTAAVLLTRETLPSWVFMWALALAIFLGFKWLTWRRARRKMPQASIFRSIGYLLFWPGMEAERFLGEDSVRTPRLRDWASAVSRTLAGAGLLWIACGLVDRPSGLTPVPGGEAVAAALGMFGVVTMLHFGFFQLVALAWQAAGVNATPVMRQPLRSTSLAEFWGRRWNTAFHNLAHQLMFRPIARRYGVARATLEVFLLSGLVHDFVISVPARGGYGLPTLYFCLQGLGVLIEHRFSGAAQDRRNPAKRAPWPIRGWFFMAAVTAAPVFLLFHPPFIQHVILPMLKFIGATCKFA